jgi:hypothetical protein
MLATGEHICGLAHMQLVSMLAHRRYTEAISLFRTQQDSIWNASALEGQCVIEMLEAWFLGDSLVIPLSFSETELIVDDLAARLLKWQHPR